MTPPLAQAPYARLLLEVPEAKWLWSSRAASSLGDAMQLVALLWLSSQAPAAGVAVGAMAFAATGPPVILGPFLGPIVDRANQRFLLLVSHLVRALITLSIPFAYTTYGIWGAFVPVLIQTSLGVLFNVTYAVTLPELVGHQRLVQVNGMNATLGHGGRVLGAALGGALLAPSRLMLPFALTAAAFTASALVLLPIPRERFAYGPGEKAGDGYVATLVAGLQHVRNDRRLLWFLAIGALATIGFTPAPVALVMLANQVLKLDSSTYGALQGLTTAGLAGGAFLVGWIGRGRRKASVMAVGYMAMGLATALLGLSFAFWVAALTVIARSGFNSVVSVPGVSLLQSLVPTHARGRALTLVNTAQGLPRVVLLPLAGLLVDWLGVRTTYAFMGVTITLAGLLAWAVRDLLEPRTTDRRGESG